MGITNYEKETIINFNAAEDMASVYTHDTGWQRHLEEKLGLKPIAENSHGGKEYQIDKHRIPRPRAKIQLSAEEKQRRADKLRQIRSSKQ